MREKTGQPAACSLPDGVAVPAGAPAWITPELLAHTLTTWQPYYAQPLQVGDALEILLNVGHLLDLLESPQ